MAVIHNVWTTNYKVKDTPIRIIDSTGLPNISMIKGYYTGGSGWASTATKMTESYNTMGNAATEDLYKQSGTAASESQSFYDSPAPCQVCFGNMTQLSGSSTSGYRIRVASASNTLLLQWCYFLGTGYTNWETLSTWVFRDETSAPADIYVKLWLLLQGGGGGGAPSHSYQGNGTKFGGGGGGSGGLLLAPFKLKANSLLDVRVGWGGTGGTADTGKETITGEDGGSTRVFNSLGEMLARANGGTGGKVTSTQSSGGTGGTLWYKDNDKYTYHSYATISEDGVGGGYGVSSGTGGNGGTFPAPDEFTSRKLDYSTTLSGTIASHSGGTANSRGGGGGGTAFGTGGAGGENGGGGSSPATSAYGAGGGGADFQSFKLANGGNGAKGAAFIIY